MRPGAPAVLGLVDAVADRQIGPLQAFAAADVEDVGIRGSHGNGADGSGWLRVERWRPRAAVIGGLPHATVDDADVEQVRPIGNAGGGLGASAAVRAYHAVRRSPVAASSRPEDAG